MGEHRRTVKGLGGVGMSEITFHMCDKCGGKVMMGQVYHHLTIFHHPAAKFEQYEHNLDLCDLCFKKLCNKMDLPYTMGAGFYE